MRQLHGQSHRPLVALHGGAGGQDSDPQRLMKPTASLRQIATKAQQELAAGADALEVCVRCLVAMEDDEQFNAGRGAALQSDGQARLTAALMDGARRSFSGAISVSYTNHPSRIAAHLQGRRARVLTQPGVDLVARQLGLPIESALTAARVRRWSERLAAGDGAASGNFSDETYDTVGCVVVAADGRIVAGTSTGGRGFEFPGRVSDSATVAGTYASPWAGVSATGVGEEIVDDALCARLETRRRDGLSLAAAGERSFLEASELGRAYGWIAVDRDGAWHVAHTTPAMSFVVVGAAGEQLAASV